MDVVIAVVVFTEAVVCGLDGLHWTWDDCLGKTVACWLGKIIVDSCSSNCHSIGKSRSKRGCIRVSVGLGRCEQTRVAVAETRDGEEEKQKMKPLISKVERVSRPAARGTSSSFPASRAACPLRFVAIKLGFKPAFSIFFVPRLVFIFGADSMVNLVANSEHNSARGIG